MSEITNKKHKSSDSDSEERESDQEELQDEKAKEKRERNDLDEEKRESDLVEGDEMTMLECLAALSSFDRATRLQAASSLIKQLAQEKGSENLELVVERLCKGLASGREGSRQGFSITLSELLRRFPEVSLEKVMSVVEESMDATGEKGDVEKQIYLGKIFAVACILRSGRLEAEVAASRAALLNQLLGVLVAMFEKKSYLKELVAHTVIELLAALRDGEERKIALPALAGFLGAAPEDCSPEALAVLLSLRGAEASSFNAEWSKGTPLLLQSDRIKHALLASSYTHPRRHFVWSLVAEACFGAAANEMLRSVWTLIDSALFGSHVDNRKYLAFSLLADFVGRAQSADDVVFLLSQPNTTRALVNHLASSKKTKMTEVATHALDELKKKVESTEGLGAALLQARYLAPINLDLQIVPLLTLEAGVSYLRSLLSSFSKEQGERLVSAIKRGWKKWGHPEENRGALAELASEIVHVFGKMAYLSSEEADKQWAKQRLFSVLAELEATGHANLLELCQWLRPQMDGDLASEAKKLLKRANRLPAPGSRYENAFVKIVGLVTLLNVQGSDTGDVASVDQWDDALTAHAKFVEAVKHKDLKVEKFYLCVCVF